MTEEDLAKIAEHIRANVDKEISDLGGFYTGQDAEFLIRLTTKSILRYLDQCGIKLEKIP